MRIVRLRTPSGPRFGHLDGDVVSVLDAMPYDGRAAATDRTVPFDPAALLAPVTPANVFAVGRNYAAHAAELGLALGQDPSLFLKPTTSLLAPGGTVVLPPPDLAQEVQHEVELAVVIGRTTRNVAATEALDHVAGFTIANDVSARDLQRRDTHIARAKGFDTFCPIGPWVVPGLDPSDLAIRCRVNGELRQDGTTADLLFDVPTLISSISRWATLAPGDVILTGSPAGTGPLVAGDHVELEIDGIGVLTHAVAAAP